MQLTRFTDYSIRALMYLTMHPDRLCTVREIAQYYDISQHHLVKIIHNLAQLQYIKTIKGRTGGIKLMGSASEINLQELILALEPNMVLVECFNPESNTCKVNTHCQLKHILAEAQQAFIDSLKSYTLADAMTLELTPQI